ncbi:MAG: hypothetical protein ABIN01_05085 [Ferruginibacter sp.]
MNHYHRDHFILKILAEQYFEWEKAKKGIVAIDFESFKKKFNCSKAELELMTAKLFSEGEVMYYNVNGIEGIAIKPKGLASFAEKKYLKERKKLIFDETKNWVQVSIPILSLLLAIMIFVKSNAKLKEQDKELQAIKEQVRLLQIPQRQPPSDLKVAIDSLSRK